MSVSSQVKAVRLPAVVWTRLETLASTNNADVSEIVEGICMKYLRGPGLC